MIEAYKIAANLTLTGDAHLKMAQFAKHTTQASKSMEKLVAAMKPFNTEFMRFADVMGPLNSEFMAFNQNVTSASRRLSTVSSNAANARMQLNMLATAAGRVNSNLAGGAIAGAGGGKGRTGFLGSAGGLAGFAALIGGADIIGTGYHQGSEYQKYIGQLKVMGFSGADISKVTGFTNQSIPGISSTNQMQAFIDAYMATQSKSMAYSLAPTLARGKLGAKMFGGMSESQVRDAIRVAEMRGGSDHNKIAEQLGIVFNMMALSGGSLMPSELRTFMRRGPTTGSRLSDAGFLSLEPIIQELGGSTTGTALTTMRQMFVGGIGLTKNRAMDWQRLGILGPIQYDKAGRPLGSKFGSFGKKNLDLLSTDPFSFLQNVILPAYAKSGITSTSAIEQQLTYDLPRTASQMFGLMVKNYSKIMRERQNIGNLKDTGFTAGTFMATEPGAMYRLSQSFNDFAKSLNDLASPSIIKGLNALASVFEKMSAGLKEIGTSHSLFTPTNASGDSMGALKNLVIQLDGYIVGKLMASHLVKGSDPVNSHGQSGVNTSVIGTSSSDQYSTHGIG